MFSPSRDMLGFGLGLRQPHFEQVMQQKPAIGWFEIISENYIAAHEGYKRYLTDLRKDYPLVMHGVCLSIGSTDPLDEAYLQQLKSLAERLQPAWVSDHLCYTGVNGVNTHDLLPIPYTQEALSHLIPRIHHVQEKLGRAFVFENASTYLEFNGNTISEPEFLAELHKATGCGILLDVNNVYVSSVNHGWDARGYIDALPAHAIMQYHLAGHTVKAGYLVDTHNAPVVDEVWELYRYTLQQKGLRSTMIEWDDDIPPFATLLDELAKARSIAESINSVKAIANE